VNFTSPSRLDRRLPVVFFHGLLLTPVASRQSVARFRPNRIFVDAKFRIDAEDDSILLELSLQFSNPLAL
jgi:hypothetical protein